MGPYWTVSSAATVGDKIIRNFSNKSLALPQSTKRPFPWTLVFNVMWSRSWFNLKEELRSWQSFILLMQTSKKTTVWEQWQERKSSGLHMPARDKPKDNNSWRAMPLLTESIYSTNNINAVIIFIPLLFWSAILSSSSSYHYCYYYDNSYYY